MLKRLLTLWLIISTLGYGSAWAFDGHVDEVNQHRDVISDAGNLPEGDEDQPTCDHCCHASAHTMALSPFQTSTAYSGTCTGSTPYCHTLALLPATPPDRPPQS